MTGKRDEYQAMMDELIHLIAHETRLLRDVKHATKATFSPEGIKELLEPRRRAFDHALWNLLNKYGVTPGDLREQLDCLWGQLVPATRNRVIEVLAYGMGLPGAALANLQVTKIIRELWRDYLDGARKLTEKMWKKHGE